MQRYNISYSRIYYALLFTGREEEKPLLVFNCVNAICFCFIGIFNVVLLHQHEANFTTTPRMCLFSKPYYLLAMISMKQSPIIVFCIAIVHGNTGQRKISEFCLFTDVIPPVLILCDTITVLLFNSLSLLLYISAVLIICSKISSSHVIREIQFMRQKAILQRLKIFTVAQLLHSGFFALCVFVDALSFSMPMAMLCFWCFFPFLKAGNAVLYANQVVSVTDQLTKIYYNFKKWLSSLHNSLFHCVPKASVVPTSPKDFSIFPNNAVALKI
ncbi:hypothetical protein T10_12990 [Trichinella papuae]|uniref:Uncharacterized protein n=1 Tax=Trichinella papuae TaxID=268474 RepID=A0A0V1M4L8_9BILA|nr:hypothetical protein T10_12990 [Trichinella papuae]